MHESYGFARLVKADVYRLRGKAGWAEIARHVLLRRTFRVVFTMRCCQALAKQRGGKSLLPLARLWHRWACSQAGIDMPWQIQAGPGLTITHGWGLVIAPDSQFGRNVTLFHGATVGRRVRVGRQGEEDTGCPSIGDQVWIGPHAVVVGGVSVGDGSRIAANAFVIDNVPAKAVVIGNPATVTRTGCVPDCAFPASVEKDASSVPHADVKLAG